MKAVAKPVALLLAFDALRDARLPRIASGGTEPPLARTATDRPLRPRRTMPTTTTECLGWTLCGVFGLLVLLPGGAAGSFPTTLPVADTTAINGYNSGYTGTIPTEVRAGPTATLQRTSGRSSFRDGLRIHAECMAPCR